MLKRKNEMTNINCSLNSCLLNNNLFFVFVIWDEEGGLAWTVSWRDRMPEFWVAGVKRTDIKESEVILLNWSQDCPLSNPRQWSDLYTEKDWNEWPSNEH